MGSKYCGTTLKYLDRESKYFEVVGPHGGPVISEGVQILQHYSEVIGPGGPNTSKYLDRGELFQGVHFFPDRDPIMQVGPCRFIIKLVKMWPGGTLNVVVGTLKTSLDRLNNKKNKK